MSAFTATFIPTSVLVLYGVLVAIGGAFETGHALTVSSVLSTLLTLVGSELGVLYGIAVLVTILGGSYVGFDLYNRLHATPDEGEPVTVAL